MRFQSRTARISRPARLRPDRDALRVSACPACGSRFWKNCGRLPELRQTFGGLPVEVTLESGDLLHCSECDMYFREPYVSQSVLNGLYARLPATVWACDNPRPYWPQVLELMLRYSPNRTVMDVGCFTGSFLEWLPGSWRKLGIEPSAAARTIARDKGFWVCGSLDELVELSEHVGVMVLCDVLEHVVNPVAMLSILAGKLSPGGSLIVLTGATDTVPWRLFGCDYWYCSLPEHVSFLSRRWFQWAAITLGMSIRWVRYLSSEPTSTAEWSRGLVRATAYTLARRLIRKGVSPGVVNKVPLLGRAARWTSPPWWRAAKDHVLIVLSTT